MSYVTTKARLDELPEVLAARVNYFTKGDYSVLDIEKIECTSQRTGNTSYEYRVKLKNRGLFVQLELKIYSHRPPIEKDIYEAMITTSDILFIIKNDERLLSLVSDLVNAKIQD